MTSQLADRRVPTGFVDADDIVQETFVQLLKAPPGTIANPPAWLFAVAKRRITHALRSGQGTVSGQDPAEILDDQRNRWNSLTPQASAEHALAAAEVMRALKELPTRQRAAAYLRHVEGWSHAEIGIYLKCATATARVHTHRGTQQLRTSIKGRFSITLPPLAKFGWLIVKIKVAVLIGLFLFWRARFIIAAVIVSIVVYVNPWAPIAHEVGGVISKFVHFFSDLVG